MSISTQCSLNLVHFISLSCLSASVIGELDVYLNVGRFVLCLVRLFFSHLQLQTQNADVVIARMMSVLSESGKSVCISTAFPGNCGMK